ncbi:MAG: acetyl-CoA C-acyltransferase [Saprospiraceae bacterium]|nr:acetyl-CoA C-acyltransferase [Candidatus Vicinibacter affinis]MBP6173887.1 acetyl-CoA C-acyltransferase [Saprospiraceae bacterium]MBK7301915.1 acetyl-CoA C-acyltransferase [Candidatus Vicinibacter affinis]MBK7797857.1 acetyl-CoA C-acyltransferase [Candidatus Vicinibacter affinis]MBK8641066.1 acetyl-CoA C-acyltransferase [Candidatus Vicinibacter affinis]
MKTSYIIDGVRTPIGSLGGMLSTVRTDDLAAHVIKKLMEKFKNLDPFLISDVILGCANQSGEDNRNIARMALLLAGLPTHVPGETVNRLCASGMSAVVNAHRAIQNGDGEIFIAGGVEGMTRGPWIISKTSSAFGRDAKMFDSTFGWRFINPLMERNYGCDSMGQTAENLAKMYQISREDQDLLAYNSQMKYNKALKSNRFEKEIGAIEVQSGKKDTIWMVNDEFPKPATTPEKLSMLKPAFDVNGTVTAGNSSGLNDGAAALLIASEKVISQQNLQPIARIVSNSVVGVEPRIMGIGPVEASKRALDKAGLRIGEMDIIELNEAFAAQVLACTRNLGLEDEDPRLNPNGGAIALGHPLGMSGARLILTAAKELQVRQKKYALCTMCIGVGQGYAVILERV